MKIEHFVSMVSRFQHACSEDVVRVFPITDRSIFFVVVDGHGFNDSVELVSRFAEFVAYTLWEKFSSSGGEKDWSWIFSETDKEASCVFSRPTLGAVATCFVIEQECSLPKITIAYAGDCRVSRFQPDHDDGYEAITTDHRIQSHDEWVRLKSVLEQNDQFRILYGLSRSHPVIQYFVPESLRYSRYKIKNTRGFGFRSFVPLLISEPEIQVFTINPNRTFWFSLSSDGGKKLTKDVFRHMNRFEHHEPFSLDKLSLFIEQWYARRHSGCRRDETALFIKCSPD